jgi:large subunit ribosomal protein L25
MTTSSVELELQPRELLGKKVGRLRRAGIIPVHLYGPGMESRSLQCVGPRLVQALTKAGASTPISVTIEGEPGNHLAFAREVQWDPRRDVVLHVDLLAADVARPATAQVTVSLTGESPGAARSGGSVTQQLFSIEVQALPLDMPSQAEVNLEKLTEPDGVIRVGDIDLGPGVTILTDSEEFVARVDTLRGAEAAAEEGTGAEAESGG